MSPTLRHNKWFYPENWGAPMVSIDYTWPHTLIKDDRVHPLYKNNYPTLCENYVLWRVQHDGSCWVSSGITQLIYQMIEAGPKKFDEVVEYFKTLLDSDPAYDQVIASDLFSILDLIRKKMDHNFSLSLRNYSNIYEALERGFRKILAIYWKKHNVSKSAAINESFTVGYAADFKDFFNELGFKYAEFLTDGEVDGADATMSYFDLSAYISEEEAVSLGQENQIGSKMPAVMSFLTMPGFMDVAVQKNISEKINLNNSESKTGKLNGFFKLFSNFSKYSNNFRVLVKI